MKSKITLIIVCLLCFVLVLPSCDGAGEQKTEDTNLSETESKTTVDSEQTTEEQTTEEQTTEEIEVDYSKFVFNGGNLVEFYEKYGSYSVTVDNKEDFVEAWDLIRDIGDLDIYIYNENISESDVKALKEKLKNEFKAKYFDNMKDNVGVIVYTYQAQINADNLLVFSTDPEIKQIIIKLPERYEE